MSAPFAKGSKLDPRIKPRQWGPLSAVQFAVRANAERMGLPRPALCLPFWEAAGSTTGLSVTDYASGEKYSPFGEDTLGFVQTPQSELAFYMSTVSQGFIFNASSLDKSNISCAGSILLPGYIWLQRINIFFWGAWNKSRCWGRFIFSTSSGPRIGFAALGDSSDSQYVMLPSSYYSSRISYGFSISPDGTAQTYAQGEHVGDATYDVGSLTGTDDLDIASGVYGGESPPYNQIYYYVFAGATSFREQEHIHHEPYALLMPVARPVYFDLAATPGPATPTNLQGTPSTDSILWTWEAGS